jgi:nucleoside-diphosphate-sugar epimerase
MGMSILVGGTGFVGGHLAQKIDFAYQVGRKTINSIIGLETDLLICAALPAEKWRANQDPSTDWINMCNLAQILTSVRAKRAVLISTIDVYQPANKVNENIAADFDGKEAYGVHRAWFEAFFQVHFSNTLVLRLPALFGPNLRKNFLYDLLHGRVEQWSKVNPSSTFQWFDVTHTWSLIQRAWNNEISVLNVSSEPVTAQEVANLFRVNLTACTSPFSYDMRSIHTDKLGGQNGYLYTAKAVLSGIASLCEIKPQ